MGSQYHPRLNKCSDSPLKNYNRPTDGRTDRLGSFTFNNGFVNHCESGLPHIGLEEGVEIFGEPYSSLLTKKRNFGPTSTANFVHRPSICRYDS